MVGMGVMAQNLALNIESRGYGVAVYNRTTSKVDEFIGGRAKGKKFVGVGRRIPDAKQLQERLGALGVEKSFVRGDDLEELMLIPCQLLLELCAKQPRQIVVQLADLPLEILNQRPASRRPRRGPGRLPPR